MAWETVSKGLKHHIPYITDDCVQCYPQVRESWDTFSIDGDEARHALGSKCYMKLLERTPSFVPLFDGADMEALSLHLGTAVGAIAVSLGDLWSVRARNKRNLGQ